MENNEAIFASGFFFDKPHENAPDFIKGKISIKADEATTFIKAHANEKGYVNLDLKKSKEGKLYLQLNTFVPEKKEESADSPF